MSKSKMLKVAEGIMDSAAKEYREINLTDIASVQMYAENGLNIYLTNDEAEKVLGVCKRINSRQENGEVIDNNDWYYEFEAKLA